MENTTVGVDLAKSIFQIHAVDAVGQVVVRKVLRRAGPIYSAHMRCLVGEEAQPSTTNLVLLSQVGDVVSLGRDFQSLRSYRRSPAGPQPTPPAE